MSSFPWKEAAGVLPLVRIMRPIFLLVLPLFWRVVFRENISIARRQQKSLRSLLVSIKISQPAVEIPEGVFYSMKNFNLYVEKKNAETGMYSTTPLSIKWTKASIVRRLC